MRAHLLSFEAGASSSILDETRGEYLTEQVIFMSGKQIKVRLQSHKSIKRTLNDLKNVHKAPPPQHFITSNTAILGTKTSVPFGNTHILQQAENQG